MVMKLKRKQIKKDVMVVVLILIITLLTPYILLGDWWLYLWLLALILVLAWIKKEAIKRLLSRWIKF